MDFKQKFFFDQPSALRQFYGIILNFNKYSETISGSSHVSFGNGNLYVLINCRQSEVLKVLAEPISRDLFELGLG